MAPISPGKSKLGRPGKKSQGTAPQNKHRFESFTKRISRIKIDPVHTVEVKPVQEDESGLSQSYFRSALDEWVELNQSQTFTTFVRQVNPLSENLPQLLHHRDDIFLHLANSIEKNDALALEPLLVLLAHLARDLGVTFESYFPRSVKLVIQVAASQNDAEVVEWSFTCLAWMFKYLSRLLVQDLRPLLEITAPYMSAKKNYVRQFLAESMGFLLKKAALLYRKKKAPLKTALKFLLQAARDIDNEDQHRYALGVKALLVEVVMGIDEQLHTSAPDFFTCLLDLVLQQGDEEAFRVMEGVLTGILHRTDKLNFEPVFRSIETHMKACLAVVDTSCTQMPIRLIYTMTGVRKGSRVPDWKNLFHIFGEVLVQARSAATHSTHLKDSILTTAAMLVQYAPSVNVALNVQSILDLLESFVSIREVFTFTTTVYELGVERFHTFLEKPLQKYIVAHFTEDENAAVLLLHDLNSQQNDGEFRRQKLDISNAPGYQVWKNSRLADLKRYQGSMNEPSVDRLIELGHLVEHTSFPDASESFSEFNHDLRTLIVTHITEPGDFEALWRRLCVGDIFFQYLNLPDHSTASLAKIWNHILQAQKGLFRIPRFLQACQKLIEMCDIQEKGSQTALNRMRDLLIHNLLDGTYDLRSSSISLLLFLTHSGDSSETAQILQEMQELLDIPYSIANAREIAMRIRKLPHHQDSITSDPIAQTILPFFCLGQLSSYHDQTRRDLALALGQILRKSSEAEKVLEKILNWLQKSGSAIQPDKATSSGPRSTLSPFECSNVASVISIASQVSSRYREVTSTLSQAADTVNRFEITGPPVDARTLALQVLLEIPDIAEKRSRLLIPVFLDIQQKVQVQPADPGSDSSASSHTVSPELDGDAWLYPERRMLLNLLGKFINPRVLYRSEDVYTYLLSLLSNGSVDTRKLALNAVFTWKEPALSKHKDFLVSVAENTAQTTEIAQVLDHETEESPLEHEDRNSVMPVLLRLLLGQIISRSKTLSSQESRRKSLLRLLFRMQESEVEMFLDIALGDLSRIQQSDLGQAIGIFELGLALDQQYGILRLLLSILETLQSNAGPYSKKMIDAVCYLTIASSTYSRIETESHSTASVPALVQNIRRTGIQCLDLLFQFCPELSWDFHICLLFRHVIEPRLETFATENTQGVSGLMRIFATWASNQNLLPHLSTHNPKLFSVLWQCMSAPVAQLSVRKHILQQIISPIADFAGQTPPNSAAVEIISAQIDDLLQGISSLLGKSMEKELLLISTNVLSKLAPFADSASSINMITHLLLEILQEPGRKISPHLKSSILKSISDLIHDRPTILHAENKKALQRMISNLFNYFKDDPNRMLLCQLLGKLHQEDPSMEVTVEICTSLNANSSKLLDEPDYDKRLSAFDRINNLDLKAVTSTQIEPILNNLIFMVRSDLDFSLKSNATSSVKRFLTQASAIEHPCLQEWCEQLLLPAFTKGVTEDSELIRADFIALYGHLVQVLPHLDCLAELSPLLQGNDEEASFFTNIMHIQQHRRFRAMRRMLAQIQRGTIRATTISKLLLPIIEKFVFDPSADESGQSLKGVATSTMSSLLQWITWKEFKARFRQYKTDLNAKVGSEKTTIKLLDHAAEALRKAWNERQDQTSSEAHVESHLSRSLPANDIVLSEIREILLPKLADFIHYKDEAELSVRLPAAIVAVKLISILPEMEISFATAPIVLDVAQVLRSKTQESRDIARKTLSEIYGLLGAPSMQFILKELKNVLTRGSQLHVLSFTLHTILLMAVTGPRNGELDYCTVDVAGVIMDDIFGTVGQEKENPDYLSTMREVKGNKSFDSMEILAQITSPSHLHLLIDQIQVLLAGSLSSKMSRQVDELLRRIGVGITKNPLSNSRDVLVFSYQLIQRLLGEKYEAVQRKLTNDERNRHRFIVQLLNTNKTTSATATPLQHKVVRFAIDLLRSTLQKYSELLTVENVSGFLPLIGDCLLDDHEDVKTSTFRLLSTIIKLPLDDLDRNAPLYIKEAVKVVMNAANTNEESAQASLKFIATVVRERKNATVKESDIAQLLHQLIPDLDEPDRQGVSFNFVRAIMSRKMQLPELYDVADKVGVMMVTSHSRSARDVARQVYVHFLLEYPQTSSRWTKQKKFLLKNLEYEHAEGRQSVLETIHLLALKVGSNMKDNLVDEFMVAVLLVMVNDDHQSCREMAALVVSYLFREAPNEQQRKFLDMVAGWTDQSEKQTAMKLGLQTYSIYMDSKDDLPEADLERIRDCVTRVVLQGNSDDGDAWELHFHALQLLLRLTKSTPNLVTSQKQSRLWSQVQRLLTNSHAWIQTSSAELLSLLLQRCTDFNKKAVLSTPYGLRLDEQSMLDLMRSSLRILSTNFGNTDLNTHILPILALLARHFDAHAIAMPARHLSLEEDAECSDEDDADVTDNESGAELSAIQYLLSCLAKILRREPKKLVSGSLLPKRSSLELLNSLLPHLSATALQDATITSLLLPLIHLTDPTTIPPRSASDQTFAESYQTLIESAQNVMETLQTKLGDQAYIAAMTRSSKLMRQRREDRRVKRRIDRVAEPEKAALLKKRKADRKKDRKREMVHDFRKSRRMRGDF